MRSALRRASAVLLAVAFLGLSVARAQTSTPTPTPTPTPGPTPIPIQPPVNSFRVDNSLPLPWPVPTFDTPVATPQPTLWDATPAHGTDYPDRESTATLQVGDLAEPVNNISTPAAAIIGSGPTPDGSSLSTGVDSGLGTVTFSGFASNLGSSIGPIIGVGKSFINGLFGLSTYAPFLAPVVGAQIIGLVIQAFTALIILIIRVGNWLINFVIKALTMFGSFVP